MSYSRYSDSVWYTYLEESDAQIADDEVFCIASVQRLTYSQMQDDMVGCIRVLWEKCSWASIEELRELVFYMWLFMQEVELKHTVVPEHADYLRAEAEKELDEIDLLYRDDLPRAIRESEGRGRKRK